MSAVEVAVNGRGTRTGALGAALALGLAACGPGGDTAERVGSDAAQRAPLIYASNEPLRYFAERLAGAGARVRFPAGAAADPAYWRPSPEQVVAMQGADLILLNGASYESWLKEVSLPPSRLVDTSAGFRDRLIPIEDAVTHSHGSEGAHEHAGTASTTWLDPTLALEQARAVAAALSARWPEDRPLFEERLAALEGDLRTLDAELQQAVAADPGRPVLFSHPVYQYLQRRYAIDGQTLHWEPDAMPVEAEWERLEERLSAHPARWLLWEAEPLAEVAARLRGLGIESVVLETCARTPPSGDFLDAMARDVAALDRVYGAASP